MSILEKIIAQKRIDVEKAKRICSVQGLLDMPLNARKANSFTDALRKKGSSGIIAEIKRRSPSKGEFMKDISVEVIASGYEKAGAAAISVLTDSSFSGGSLDDLKAARAVSQCPILRKDFIIDEYQIYEAKAHGADAILLIAAVLEDGEIEYLTGVAKAQGLEVLLEIHSKMELEHKFCEFVDMIGINNRNLGTFAVDVNLSISLAGDIPESFVKVSESGIGDPETVLRLRNGGFAGFLIGETFMKTGQPEKACEEFISALRSAGGHS